MKSICIISPSFSAGGAERVLCELANYFVNKKNAEVNFIILTGGEQFYKLDKKVKVHKPSFNYKNYPRFIFIVKILKFLRKKLKFIRPNSILSFGGKYNSFVLISSLGLGLKIFISDRSQPDISYGRLLDFLNSRMYKLAKGIIAQTESAKIILKKSVNHPNIKVIGNPIREIEIGKELRENIILNVGRFIKSKQQSLLLDFFEEINDLNWRLIFIGEGSEFDKVKLKSLNLKSSNRISFLGNINNIDKYYTKSKIFAFTSISEGFPNALGEAMKSGCACISFDCEAGPSDLIVDVESGYLIDLNDHNQYINRLHTLMNDELLITKFGNRAKNNTEKFNIKEIGNNFYNFLVKSDDENIN